MNVAGTFALIVPSFDQKTWNKALLFIKQTQFLITPAQNSNEKGLDYSPEWVGICSHCMMRIMWRALFPHGKKNGRMSTGRFRSPSHHFLM